MNDQDDLDLGQTIRGFAEGQKVFGRFKLKKILGRGGMGVVWLAWDDKLEEDIALKFLPETVRLDQVAVRDLVRETRKSRQLTHRYIVRIHDFLEDGQTAAIAMEYVAGATLGSFRLEQPGEVFSAAAIQPWVEQLAEGLTYAHDAVGLVHRDIKPSNLMVDANGEIKITDFGISSSLTDSMSRISMRSDSSGSPPYMSPQQLLGEPPKVTDDIYSLGATFYELLTGKPPFYRGNIPRQVETVVPPPMAERREEIHPGSREEIPPAWEETISACLEKDPARRPQSVREMAERIAGGAGLRPPGAKKISPTKDRPPSEGAGKANRILPVLLFVALLLAAAGAAGWYLGFHLPAEKQRLAEVARQEAEARKAQAVREAEAAEAIRLANARGGLKIVTDPPGAEVAVGALAKATSPATFSELRLGQFPLRITLEGYDPIERSVKITEDQLTDPGLITLKRSVGRAEILSTPPQQDFELTMLKSPVPDEAPVTRSGRTPATLEDLPVGSYTLEVSRPGWPPYTRKIAVERDEVVRAAAEFPGGTLQIVSKPSGATVLRDGESLGRTPLTLPDLPPGSYDFLLKLDGYRPLKVNHKVGAGETVTATADLQGIQIAGTWRGKVRIKFADGATKDVVRAVTFESDESGSFTDGTVRIPFGGSMRGDTFYGLSKPPPDTNWQPDKFSVTFRPDGNSADWSNRDTKGNRSSGVLTRR